MSNFDESEFFSQTGGEYPLGLADVDPRLTQPGKSIEDFSNPDFRLFILWTLVGQYGASADRQKDETGASMVTDDARHFQLLSMWTKEARRVDPLIRQRGTLTELELLVQSGKHVEAYNELIELRDSMPEFIHPDERFDFMHELFVLTSRSQEGDTLATIIQQDMIDETVPGGMGFCDDIERLRRYLKLSESNPAFIAVIDNFFGALISKDETIQSNYFEHTSLDLREFCETLVKRDCKQLALFVTSRGYVDLDNQAILIPLLNEQR